MKNRKTLADYIDGLQGQGKYWFTNGEALSETGLTTKSFCGSRNQWLKITIFQNMEVYKLNFQYLTKPFSYN